MFLDYSRANGNLNGSDNVTGRTKRRRTAERNGGVLRQINWPRWSKLQPKSAACDNISWLSFRGSGQEHGWLCRHGGRMKEVGLTNAEILKVVNRYIGVSGGYLGDFSYRTHEEFYPEFCGLDIDPYRYEGTTRERFIAILKGSSPEIQARILRGVIERFPVSAAAPSVRTQSLQQEICEIIRRLEGAMPIASPAPKITSAVVAQAISDTEALLQAGTAVSGIDRIHTTLHGYLRAVCDEAGIQYSKDDSITKLFRLTKQQHPALQNLGPRSQDIEKVLQAFSSVMDALNPIRNNASVAHPNETLLAKEEAELVINAARTLMHYLDAKFSKASR